MQMSSSVRHDEDTMSAAPSGGATADVLSSSPVTSDTAEVVRLRQELRQCQEKFASWKEKVKTGVDQMRAQIVDLTRKLDESTKQCELLAASSLNADTLPAPFIAQSQDCMYAHAIAAACLLVDTALLSHSGGVPGQCVGTAATCPSRSPITLNATAESLQKTIKDQSDRLKEVHHALKRSTNELLQRTEALRQQDERLAELKYRIAELEAINASLKQEVMGAPNTEEWKRAQEEMDQQLARARLEYERRESLLVLQHSTEVQSLKVSHEREVQEMQREQHEAVVQAIRDTLSSNIPALRRNGADPPEASGIAADDTRYCKPNDDAYMDLLRDYKAMQLQCAAVVKERDAMAGQQQTFLLEVKDLLHSSHNPLSASAADGDPATPTTVTNGIPPTVERGSLTDATSLKDAALQIQGHRLRFARLQDELMRSRQELMRLRRCSSAPMKEGLGAQQLQYLRSVVVQLLCSLSDVRVVRHLLPVLSTLLKFTDDDLKVISKAIPLGVTNY